MVVPTNTICLAQYSPSLYHILTCIHNYYLVYGIRTDNMIIKRSSSSNKTLCTLCISPLSAYYKNSMCVC